MAGRWDLIFNAIEKPQALADTAREWGYPRPIKGYEVDLGAWQWSQAGIIWMTTPVAFVHGIGAPGQRIPEDFEEIVRDMGRALRVVRVYALLQDDSRHHRAVRRLLRIRGWTMDSMGAYLEVGE